MYRDGIDKTTNGLHIIIIIHCYSLFVVEGTRMNYSFFHCEKYTASSEARSVVQAFGRLQSSRLL